MKDKYKGSGTGFCIVFIILAIVVTVFYNHRDDLGYKFSKHYYIHDSGIMEYSGSSIASFPIKGDYSNLINRDVYYYDNSGTLKKDRLLSISLPDKKFIVSDGEHPTDKFLGQHTGGVPIVGSLLDFFTEKTLYIFAVLIPGLLCAAYICYGIVISFLPEKKKKVK